MLRLVYVSLYILMFIVFLQRVSYTDMASGFDYGANNICVLVDVSNHINITVEGGVLSRVHASKVSVPGTRYIFNSSGTFYVYCSPGEYILLSTTPAGLDYVNVSVKRHVAFISSPVISGVIKVALGGLYFDTSIGDLNGTVYLFRHEDNLLVVPYPDKMLYESLVREEGLLVELNSTLGTPVYFVRLPISIYSHNNTSQLLPPSYNGTRDTESMEVSSWTESVGTSGLLERSYEAAYSPLRSRILYIITLILSLTIITYYVKVARG